MGHSGRLGVLVLKDFFLSFIMMPQGVSIQIEAIHWNELNL